MNRARVKFDQLGIGGLVTVAGPFMVCYEETDGQEITVNVALPVAGPFMVCYEETDGQEITVNVALPVAGEPARLPAPARYRVLPAIEAAAAVRNGLAASIYPMVYQDLVAWIEAHGYQPQGPGRDIWIHEVDDISEADQQVFEAQLAFTRPAASA